MRTDEPQPIRRADYRPLDYKIDAIHMDVALDPGRTVVTSTLAVRRAETAAPDAPLVLNGEVLELLSVAVNGETLTTDAYVKDDATLTLRECPPAFDLKIETACAPDKNTSLSGLYVSEGMLCTQCEAEGFRRITYYLDRPDNLATFKVRMEGDKSAYPVLLANGNPVGAGEAADGRHWAEWEDPHPKPSYLFAMVAGDLACVKDSFKTMSGRDVELHVYVQHKDKGKCAYTLDALKRSMAWDEEKFGREYDLDLFMIVAVDHFNFGAMENKGLNIFNSAYVLASPETATDMDYEFIESIVAHEYFHNWTGNRITCRDWFQLCLKEGLTVFRDQEFSADMRSRPVQRMKDVKQLRARQFPEDAGPLAHPVRPDSFITIDNFYTATVYEKGAELVRMMKTLLGAEKFRKAMDLYFDRHDGEAATVDDFVKCMEDAGETDLSQFALWYAQAGTPAIEVEEAYDAAEKTLALTLKQKTPDTAGQTGKKPVAMPVALGLVSKTGAPLPARLDGEKTARTHHQVILTQAEQTFRFRDVAQMPIASLFRDFSAPVKVKRNLSVDDRLALLRGDENRFNQWETARGLAMDILAAKAGEARLDDAGAAFAAYADALKPLLAAPEEDPAFLAEVLKTPTATDIARDVALIDPDKIDAARSGFQRALAAALATELKGAYDALVTPGPYSPDAASAGRRALRNAALGLMLAAEDGAAAETALTQFRTADNMTDAAAAVAMLAASNHGQRDAALAEFYDKWKDEPLVVNKWLAWQAVAPRADALDTVKALMDHPAYSQTNPNKVRALLGAFISENLVGFHRADGAGYAFFTDQIAALDALNPQVAARLVSTLENWRKFDTGRQAGIEAALQALLDGKERSDNVVEIATRLLEAG